MISLGASRGHAVRAVRDAPWLDADRARSYARVLLVGMGLTLAYHYVSVALGHYLFLPGDAKTRPIDFISFWCAGRLALAGFPAGAWNLAVLGPAEYATHRIAPGGVLAFFYPPPFLLICLPFAALPYLVGFGLFIGAQAVALFAVLRRILPAAWGLLPVLAFPGILVNEATGQNGFISAVCLGLPVLFLDRRPWLAGAALGGLAFKPHMALCVPVALLAARRWRAFVAAAGTALGMVALAWLVLGTDTYRAFFASLPVVRDALENHAEDWGKLQSLFTAARLYGAPLGVAYALQTALAVSVMAALALACWRRPGAGAEGAALAAAALLCTPHVLDYDLAVVGVPLAWLARQAAETGWLPWEKVMAGTAFVWPVVGRILTQDAHLAFGPLVLLGLFWVVLKRQRSASALIGDGVWGLVPVVRSTHSRDGVQRQSPWPSSR